MASLPALGVGMGSFVPLAAVRLALGHALSNAERAARARPSKSQTGSPKDRQGFGAFVRECVAELKRVQWPTRPQLIQATAVVIITCFIVGVYLYALDSLFSRLAGWLITQQAG